MTHEVGVPVVVPPEVDPALLGRPLAGRRQRLWAMAIDLALIGVVVAVLGRPHTLIAVALAFAAWYGLQRWVPSPKIRSLIALGALVAPMLVATALPKRHEAPEPPDTSDLEDLGISAQDAAALIAPTDPAQARAVAKAIGEKLRAKGMPEEAQADLRETLADPDLPLPPEARQVLLASMAPAPAPTAKPPSSETAALRAEIARLKADRQKLRDERDALQEKLRAARERHGLKDFVLATLDDLGLSLGWSGLYFIAFLVLWNGQTPGKRLLGIRVVRLDGKRIGWFCALERFQGYLSNVTSCLLGFAQVFWEHNLQGQHDKVTNTVVVRV